MAMKKPLLLAAAAIAVLLFLGWYAIADAAPRTKPRPEAAYGTPTSYVERPGYLRGETIKPIVWVVEYLTAQTLAGDVKRDSFDFHEDPTTPAEGRAKKRYYVGTGYDLGHLPCAANHHRSRAEMQACHELPVIVPQTPELNRSNTGWEGLEQHLRDIALSDAEVWLFTGTAFLPDKFGTIKIVTLGEGIVWVPTHCWKAALIKRGETIRLAAWLMPNNHNPPHWRDCRVAVDQVEATIGLDLFDGLDDHLEQRLEAANDKQ